MNSNNVVSKPTFYNSSGNAADCIHTVKLSVSSVKDSMAEQMQLPFSSKLTILQMQSSVIVCILSEVEK